MWMLRSEAACCIHVCSFWTTCLHTARARSTLALSRGASKAQLLGVDAVGAAGAALWVHDTLGNHYACAGTAILVGHLCSGVLHFTRVIPVVIVEASVTVLIQHREGAATVVVRRGAVAVVRAVISTSGVWLSRGVCCKDKRQDSRCDAVVSCKWLARLSRTAPLQRRARCLVSMWGGLTITELSPAAM